MDYSALKKRFEQLRTIYEQISVEEQSSFRDKVLIAYGQYTIDMINKLLQRTPGVGFLEDLWHFFRRNELLIQGSLCEYSAIPAHEITKFLVDCACYLSAQLSHSMSGGKPISALRLLFSSVKSFEKLTATDFLNLEEEDISRVINQHALTVDGQYFISILEIMQALTKTHTQDFDQKDPIRHNPFSDGSNETNYSDDDLTKAKNHSLLTREIVALKEEQMLLCEKDSSLLKALIDLMMEFRCKGVGGIGSEMVAAKGAETALLRFLNYWEALPSDSKAMAEDIEPFKELKEAFIAANTEKNEPRMLFIHEKEIAMITPEGGFQWIEEGYKHTTLDDKTTIYDQNNEPLVILEKASILWKCHHSIKIAAKNHVGEAITCINGWQKQLNDIINDHKEALSTITPSEVTLKEQIKANQDALDRAIRFFEKSLEEGNYVGDNPAGNITVRLLSTLNIPFHPKNTDELFNALRNVSVADLKEICCHYSEEINDVIKEVEDVVIAAVELTPEKFDVFLSYLDISIFNEELLECFLKLDFISKQYKKILVEHFHQRVTTSDFFCRFLVNVGHSSFKKEEKKAFIRAIISKATAEYARFCESNLDFCRMIKTMGCSMLGSEEKKKILIPFIEKGLNEHNGFCENGWHLVDCINVISHSMIGVDDKRTLILSFLLRNFDQCFDNFHVIEEFCLLIKSISDSVLFDEHKNHLLSLTIVRLMERPFSSFQNRHHFCDVVRCVSESALSKEIKRKFLQKFVEQGIRDYHVLCEDSWHFHEIIRVISKSALSKVDKKKYLASFIQPIIEKNFGFCQNAINFDLTINVLSWATLSTQDKRKSIRFFIQEGLDKSLGLFQSNWHFREATSAIGKCFLPKKEKEFFLKAFFAEYIQKKDGLCHKNEELIETIAALDNSLLSIDDKKRLLLEFLSRTIEKNNGFCKKTADIFITLKAIEKCSIDEEEKSKMIFHFITKQIDQNFFFCNENKNFLETIECFDHLKIDAVEKSKLLRDFMVEGIYKYVGFCMDPVDFFKTLKKISAIDFPRDEKINVLVFFLKEGIRKFPNLSLESMLDEVPHTTVFGESLKEPVVSQLTKPHKALEPLEENKEHAPLSFRLFQESYSTSVLNKDSCHEKEATLGRF